MTAPLNEAERRALRLRARKATLAALRELGGEAHSRAIREWALAHGGFTPRELTAAAPERAREKYANAVHHQLAWTLTNLKDDGLVAKSRWGMWKLTAAATEPVARAVRETTIDPHRLAQLRAMSYQRYLMTPEWKQARAVALAHAGNRCALDVNHTSNLEVHHRTYERRGAELITDLLVLCHSCHQLHHRAYGLPRQQQPTSVPSTPPPLLLSHAERLTVAPNTVPERPRKRPLLARLLSLLMPAPSNDRPWITRM